LHKNEITWNYLEEILMIHEKLKEQIDEKDSIILAKKFKELIEETQLHPSIVAKYFDNQAKYYLFFENSNNFVGHLTKKLID